MSSDPDRHPTLIGDELVEALEALLDVHPAGEDAPYLGYIDGALAGLLLSPEPIPPEEWLPKLGIGSNAQFPDAADGERFAALLRMRQAEIAALLIEGGLAFLPIYEFDDQGKPIWQIWLAGFLGAMQMRNAAWGPLFKSEDEDLGAALMGIMSLAATLPGLRGNISENGLMEEMGELADEASMLLPYFVETIYRRRHGLARAVMDDGFVDDEDWTASQQPLRVQKVGRNEPCPCGSGKKHKKCCGALV